MEDLDRRIRELEKVLDLSPEAIIIAQDGKFVYANAQFRSMVTVSDPELTSVAFVNFIHPDDRLKMMQGYAQILAGDATRSGTEFRTVTEEGVVRWYDCVAQTIKWHGNPAVMTSLKEITDRKKVEDTLEKSESRYAQLVENVPVGLYEVDLKTNKLVRVNDFICETMGYSREEMLSVDASTFVDEKDRARSLERLKMAIDGDVLDETTEMRFRTKTGELLWALVSARVIHEDGEPVRAAVVAYDITLYKRVEEELQKIEKIESLGVLAGGIAHDFNNILTAVVGSISMARLTQDPTGRLHMLMDQAERACFQARSLTQQLLTFSEGGLPIRQPTSVEALVEECVGFSLRGSKVKAEVIIPPDIWAVDVDSGQIAQVINNLVINAQQAMPDGGTVKIGATNEEVTRSSGLPIASGPYVLFSVRDHGVGIAASCLPKIFDPYFTTKAAGSGLGLATAYSIIKRHNGHIEVVSTEGEGTTFLFYLPALREAPEPLTSTAKSLQGGRGKVLLMDDDESVRRVGGQMLEHLGFDVVCATEGAQAIELYKKSKEATEPFDFLVLDLTVPGGAGGKETLGEILKIDPDVRAVVASGYSNDPVMANAKDHGFIGVLKKPFTVEQLDELIQRLVLSR